MRLHFKLLFALIGFSSMITVAQAGELPFTDADRSDHFEAIYKMKEWGIFDGYSDGSFGYIKEINRAELSKALVLGSGLEESEVSSCADGASKSFSDVAAGQWYADYVYCAQANGWVSGDDGADTFRPGDPVLLPEAFKMILESQYGTPDESFEGEMWYDLYINPLIDSNIIYRDSDWSSYYYYTFLPGYQTMGFDSIITSKSTRQDIAELLYRVRTVLEEGDGDLAIYNPLISMADYEEKYGASVEETSSGVLTIEDPYFGFEITNVYIGDFDPGDLEIFIEDPSGFENGSRSDWNLMVPSIRSDYEEEELDYDEMITIRVEDPDSDPDEELSSRCTSKYSRPFELWEIYDTLCGEDGATSDELSSLLQLTTYGESYTGEAVDLEPIKNGPLSILKFNYVMAEAANFAYWYEYGSGEYLDYLESLEGLQSEDSEQEEVLQSWREAFIASFEMDDEDTITASYFALEPILDQYEWQVLESFSDTIVVKIRLSQATSYNHPEYIDYDASNDYEVIEGEVGDYFWTSFALFFAEENDPFEGQYFGTDQGLSDVWVQITVENMPTPSADFDSSSVDWNHVMAYAQGLWRNAYYYEIVNVEVVEGD